MKLNEETTIAKLIGLGRVTVDLKGKRETFKKVVSVSGAYANGQRDDGSVMRIYKRAPAVVIAAPEIDYSQRPERSGARLSLDDVREGDMIEWLNGIGGTETAKAFRNGDGDLVVKIGVGDRELKLRILLGIDNGARIVT